MTLNRRSFLMLGTAAALSSGLAPARAEFHPRPEKGIDPVLFWNAVCLDLVALDHSVDVENARAPGPCASAMALGVAHAVIADAVHVAYGTDYRPQFFQGRADFHVDVPELFVGGAASGILTYIFNTPTHGYVIGLSGERFKQLLGVYQGKDWQAGVAFANSPSFRALWSWERMQRLLLPKYATYVPRPRGHNVDPYNAGQGYYGFDWGTYRPLVLEGGRQVAALMPGAPPPEGSPEYERDVAEVRVKGALRPHASRYFAPRTPHETNIGLFWAYDGARLIGTPPRLYNQIVRQIAVQDGFNVVEMARLLALCNIAMADAAIVAWKAKFRYNVWRPVLGIQNHAEAPEPGWLPFGSPKSNPTRMAQGMPTAPWETAQTFLCGPSMPWASSPGEEGSLSRGGGRGRSRPFYRDAAFTPNFPAYPSGHATFGGACFTVLKLLRRERLRTRHNPDAIHGEFVSDELNGTCQDHASGGARPLYPLVYKGIDDMIKDNDLSRIYLGVHWRFDCSNGSASGRRIGHAVYEAAYRPHDAYDRSRS